MNDTHEAANWGREIVPVLLNGAAYTASAGSICSECRSLFGEVSTTSLERYGVSSELFQVCLAFWAHNFPELCGDYSDIPCQPS